MISRESSENEQDNNMPSTKKKSKKTDLAEGLLQIEVNEFKQDYETHKNIISIETD
jgi:hypothetical protein